MKKIRNSILLLLCLSLIACAVPALSEEADDDIVEFTMVAALYSDAPDMNNEWYTEWFNYTKSKIDIEWIPSGDFHTKYNIKLSSGDIPDVSAVPDIRTATLVSAIKNGVFWDLTDALGDLSNYPNMKANLRDDTFKYLSVDGRIYALPRSRSRIDNALLVRSDWLEQLGLEIPTTLDEYVECLRAVCAADCDGNGKTDTIGYISSGIPSHFESAFGVQPVFDEDGGFIIPKLTEEYGNMVEWLRGLYAEGLLAAEFPAIKNTEGIELFTTGVGFSYNRSIWWVYDWEQQLNAIQEGAKIACITLEGPEGYVAPLNTGVSGGFYINSNVSEEKMLRLLDYFDLTTSEYATQLAYFGVEGVHHDLLEDGTRKLNELGAAQVTTTEKGVGCLTYGQWVKVDSSNAPLAYNLARREEVASFEDVGTVQYFGSMISETYSEYWSEYESEVDSMITQAICGEISMEEYREYMAGLRADPLFKQMFQEFAASYNDML